MAGVAGLPGAQAALQLLVWQVGQQLAPVLRLYQQPLPGQYLLQAAATACGHF